MSDVPKFVRQRAAQQATGDHPDANLLAAFAEGGLTKDERAHVLAHLGTCAACRDVLALALPASPDAASAPAPAERSWLRWPMLRWAGAAAAVVVVAAAAMLMKQHQQRPDAAEYARVAQSADKPAASNPAELPPAPSVAAPTRSEKKPSKDAGSAMAAKKESKVKAFKKEDVAEQEARHDAPALRALDRSAQVNQSVPQAPGGSTQHFSRQAAKVQQAPTQSANARPVPAPTDKLQTAVSAAPPSAATGAGVGTGSGAGVRAGAAGVVVGGVVGGPFSQQQLGAAKAAPSQARVNNETVQVDEQAQVVARDRAAKQIRPAAPSAESVEAATAAPAAAMNKAGRAPMTIAKMAAIIPRWRVSAQGEVERSLDAGGSWHAVPVATGSVFRSVSAVDHDVWAGGAGGALYHSADDGRTWTRVTVKTLDMVLATEIARVEFTDAQHGSVITASGVTWTTADAGVTWSLRSNTPR